MVDISCFVRQKKPSERVHQNVHIFCTKYDKNIIFSIKLIFIELMEIFTFLFGWKDDLMAAADQRRNGGWLIFRALRLSADHPQRKRLNHKPC